MYVPAHFAMPESEVTELLVGLGAAELITAGPDGLIATLLPLVYDRVGNSLSGHVARNNPHWRAAVDATAQSLVIARGPDAYVSPSWYPSKLEHGRVVPTWNYVTVHVYGRLVVRDDVGWVSENVRRLTELHESRRQPQWAVADAPADYLAGQLRAIVGLELQITRIEAKAKLSQNKSLADQDGVRTGLAGTAGGPAVAALMQPRHVRAD